jgi:hypothetical protein
MEFVYHIGSQCTDDDRLVRSLLRDRGPLARRGVAVPAPGRYRPILRETLIALRGQPAPAETQEVVLDAMLDDRSAERVILSHEYFLGIPSRAVTPRGFHPSAGRKVAAIANLFPDSPCEFHMAVRNPATLLPALIAQTPGASYASVMGDGDPMSLRWAPVIEEICTSVPGIRLVVWCNEDSPVLWPDILHRMTGCPDLPLEGANDLLASVLSPSGLKKFETYLASRAPLSPAQRRRAAAAFLDKFGLSGEVEVALPFPGWSENLVTQISQAYESDILAIAGLPGVEVLLP